MHTRSTPRLSVLGRFLLTLGATATGLVSTAQADVQGLDLPVPVAQEPIGRSTGLAPNVLILMDDSHSMDHSHMPDSISKHPKLKGAFHGGTTFAYNNINPGGHFFAGRMWYDSNTDFPINLIRFDPNKDYLPWPTGEPRPSPNADFPRVKDSPRDLLDAPRGLPDSPGETRRTRLWFRDEVVYYKNTKDKKYFGEKHRKDPEGNDGWNGYTVGWWVNHHRSMTDLRDTKDFNNPSTGLHTAGALPPLYIMRANEQYIKNKYGGVDAPRDETQYFKITFALNKNYGLWNTELSGVKYDPNNKNDPLNDVWEDSQITRDFGKSKAWPKNRDFVFLDKDGKVTRRISPQKLFENYWNFLFYHNSRQALARGALLETIAERGEDLRVGYTTLHPTMSKTSNKLGNCEVESAPGKRACDFSQTTAPLPILHRIPVNTDDGLLTPANRKTLVDYIMNSRVNSGLQTITALRYALHTAGQYFSDATSSDSPYKGRKTMSCRQNLALMLTDGIYFKENPSGYGDVDGTAGETIVSANGVRSYTYKPAAPYRDGPNKKYSNSLADVAMYYWKRDLVPENDTEAGKNDVPVTGNDPAFWQHMRTYAISFGEGQVLENGIAPGMPGASRNYWESTANFTGQMEDLWHAAVNGRGQYFTAYDSAQLAHALKTILGEANSGSGPGSTSAASAYLFDDADSGDILQFSASYSASSLSSTLQACKLGTVCSDDNSAWDVSKRLAASGTGKDGVPGSARNIFFNNGAQVLPFEWDNLTASQKRALANGKEQLGKDTVRYLRGDYTLDGNPIADPDTEAPQEQNWRTRAELDGGSRNVLGMIVHGTPTFIGAPEDIRAELSSTLSGYKEFQKANEDRPRILYAAANDGMVHAIITERRALTVIADGKGTTRTYEPGDELFAFMPAAAINKNMRDFTRPPFETNQRFLLDGELNYSEVKLGDKWRTVLVGSMGAAGAADSEADPAVFALDVTDPTQPRLLWEVSSSEMGQTMGRPVIAPVADGKWSVFIGAGPNQTKTKSNSAIMQIDLETGNVTALQGGAMASVTKGGILGLHVVDSDKDNYADTIYAGDLAGNLWKVSNVDGKTAGGVQYAKLFHAPRPITAPPTSTVDKTGKRWLFFGSGRALTDADLIDTKTVDTWYGIQDIGAEVKDTNLVTRNYAVVQTPRNPGEPVEDAVIMNYAVAGDMEGKLGWQIPLNQSKDATTPGYMVLQSRVRNGFLVGQMNFKAVPEPSCDGLSIKSRLMVLDPFTGAVSPDNAALGNIDVNDDGFVDEKDLYSGGGGSTQPGNNPAGTVPIVGLGFGRGELSGSLLIVQIQHVKGAPTTSTLTGSATADEYTRTCAIDANGKRVCMPPDPEGKPPSKHTWMELRYDDVQ